VTNVKNFFNLRILYEYDNCTQGLCRWGGSHYYFKMIDEKFSEAEHRNKSNVPRFYRIRIFQTYKLPGEVYEQHLSKEQSLPDEWKAFKAVELI